MNPAELERLEKLVDEAREIRRQMTQLNVIRQHILELHSPMPKNVRKTVRVSMIDDRKCMITFTDSSNGSRDQNLVISENDGFLIIEDLIGRMDKIGERLQKRMEEMR